MTDKKETLYELALRFTDGICAYNCDTCPALKWRGEDPTEMCIIYFLSRIRNCGSQIQRLIEWGEENERK